MFASVSGFGKLCFSFGKQIFESVFFGSVKVGFWSIGVLANCSFYFASKPLKKFVLVKQRLWLFGVLAISIFNHCQKLSSV